MTERELARKSHHHVPRLPRIGEIQDQDRHREHVVVDHCRQREQDQHEHREQHGAAAHGLFPSRPCGRNSSTRISSAKLNMLFADGVKYRPASASDTPISTPPSSAPAMEPSPPTITMTNASSV